MSEESAWQLPPVRKCNNPYDHKTFPSLHEHGDFRLLGEKSPCPLHSLHYRKEREKEQDWRDWAAYRECFTKAIDEENADYFMQHMLECVTLAVPPVKTIWMTTESTSAHWKPPNAFLVIVCCMAVVFAVTAFLAILL